MANHSSDQPPPSSNVIPLSASKDEESSTNTGDGDSLGPSGRSNSDHSSAAGSSAHDDTHGSGHHIMQAAAIALVVNLIISTLKLGVHFTISPSAALFSEGLHSLGDSINSVLLMIGIVRGNRLPDRSHPFGYGLETNFWALFASFLLFLSAGWAMYEGIFHLLEPSTVMGDPTWPIVILSASLIFEIYAIHVAASAILNEVGVKATLFNTIPKGFQHVGEAKVPTTRYVFFEDTLAFLGAFTALVAIISGELLVHWHILSSAQSHIPDAIGSIIIAIILLLLAARLFIDNRSILLGSAASAKMEAAIRKAVLQMHGVSQIHDLKTIDQGHAGLMIHMTVEVEPDTPVKDMDDLTERVKRRLARRFKQVRQEQVFIEVQADESHEEWSVQFNNLLSNGLQSGVLNHRHEALLRRAYEFTELQLLDVMVPRTDVDYVNINTPLAEVADLMMKKGHTRWPVFGENVDDLVGIVHARDVFQHLYYQQEHTALRDIVREMDIYPETKPVSDLLEEFKRRKLQMAAVADEYGGFSGIVTIEDLMEEIIGEIWDENEVEETLLEDLEPHTIRVSGKYNIDDLNESHNLNIPEDEFVSIGGFVFGQLGREPEINDAVQFEDLTLTVETVEGPRIQTLIITSPKPFERSHTHHEESPE